MKPVAYALQFVLIRVLVSLCAALPPAASSALGGAVGRLIGPALRGHRVARANLHRAMPELDDNERRTILRGMWDHLGRVFAEYPHLERIWSERTEKIGMQYLEAVAAEGGPALFAGGHIGNWELPNRALRAAGLDPLVVYRHPNNRLLEGLLIRLRGGRAARKGADGARKLMAELKAGGTVAMLVDQKMNDGIAVPFFGIPAMTAPALAQMALRFEAPVILIRCERLEGCRFRITVLPPMTVEKGEDRSRAVTAAMARINPCLEGWIRQRPAQWLWSHRRWPPPGQGPPAHPGSDPVSPAAAGPPHTGPDQASDWQSGADAP